MKIVVCDACKSFGELLVFKNINIEFETGNFYLIKGQNGCGKTVFLKTVCGFYTLESGFVKQDGVKIRNRNNYILDAGIVIENPKFIAHLTLLENLKLLKNMSKKINDKVIYQWIDFYNLRDYVKTKYKHCSLGTKQKMALIQAFIHKPKVLILDEPFNALDVSSLQKTEDYLNSIKKDTIIILSTHINDNVRYFSDYEYVFQDNKLVKSS